MAYAEYVLATAAFRRLCVETLEYYAFVADERQPPSGGCVLKRDFRRKGVGGIHSRLQAAVC